MSNRINGEGLELAKRMAEEEEGMGPRRFQGWTYYIIPNASGSYHLLGRSISRPTLLDISNRSASFRSSYFTPTSPPT